MQPSTVLLIVLGGVVFVPIMMSVIIQQYIKNTNFLILILTNHVIGPASLIIGVGSYLLLVLSINLIAS